MARILVADDDFATRTLLQEYLSLKGHSVADAADGREAWRLAQLLRPDWILTDAQMPQMTGPELCLRVMESGLKTRVIIWSGSSEFEKLSRLAGCVEFYLKGSVRLAELANRFAEQQRAAVGRFALVDDA